MALTFLGITGLALADSVNPCEIAVLALVLITILTQNPEKRKKVLHAGLAFVASVFILYFLYGLIIIQLFKGVDLAISGVRVYLYKIFAILAILLGLFNIRDYVRYTPGRFGTEMPLSMRPRVKTLIKKITSPRGAFLVGVFVSVFLLPCSIGPYLIASGSLYVLDFLKTIPWLLYYNLIFVLPMLIITVLVYVGYTTVEKVSGWKDKNIRYLHLVAGLLLLALGLAMLTGLIA